MSVPVPQRRKLLKTLWDGRWTLTDMAEIYGGTPQGIRSTVRKMIERGELSPRVQPRRFRV